MLNFFKKRINFIYYFTLSLIVALGIYLRLRAYFLDTSIWFDEASLILNVTKNHFFPPLLYEQSSPPIFMFLLKFASIINFSDRSFRFFPLFFSILSIGVFYFLTKEYLKSKLARLIALLLFSVNLYLVYFAKECKPYSLDVLVICALILITLKIDIKNIKGKYALCLGLFYSILPFLSFASLFILPGIILYSFSIKNYKKSILFSLPIIISLTLFVCLFSSNYTSSFLDSFWQYGYISSFQSFWANIDLTLYYFFAPENFHAYFIPGFLLGAIMLFEQNKKRLLLLVCPIFLSLLAAILHKYPFSERLILFILPIILICFSKILDLKNKWRLFAFGLLFLNFSFYFIIIGEKLGSKEFYEREAIKGSLEVIQNNIKKDEKIFLFPGSERAFLYYNNYYNFDKNSYLTCNDSGFGKYAKACKLDKGKYWMLFTIEQARFVRLKSVEEILKEDYKIIKTYPDERSTLFYTEKIK